MKCPSCGSEWVISKTASQSILKNCPFCGASLEPKEKPDTTTFEGILRSMVLEYGENIYKISNAQRFKALLGDFAVSFSRERKLLSIASDNQIPQQLLKANSSDDEEKKHAAINASYALVDLGFRSMVVQEIVSILCNGLGWKIDVDMISSDDKIDSENVAGLKEKIKKSEKKKIARKIVQIIKKKSVDTDFVRLEANSFFMGYNGRHKDEMPVHKVGLSAFFICDHEVTQDEYTNIMKINPSHFKGGDRPVESVSWYDAIEYCNKRSLLEGLNPCYTYSNSLWTCDFSSNGYRLPTEAEWEYAALDGLDYSGSTCIDDVAWYEDNSENQSRNVKLKKPNKYGLYDMSGNVWEWCYDWYGPYDSVFQLNPTGVIVSGRRVLRGGSWKYNAASCCTTNRYSLPPTEFREDVGFRVVRSGEKS